MTRISRERFEALVVEALGSLPEEFASRMSNVEVVVEEEPSADVLRNLGLEPGGRLLGLYQGVPLTSRNNNYFGVLPDRISLYQRNIEQGNRSAEQIREVVKRTVIHEIAHHFGIDDKRLEELGWA